MTAPIKPKKRTLSKAYEPESFESELYSFWDDSGCFEASDSNAKGQKSYCIVHPPPNVTGVLHMGHALTATIQDTLIRWRRMQGFNTLLLPGMDHAGIATQMVVERSLAPKTRHDLGREEFVKRTWQWKEEHGGIINKQLRSLGCSMDWRRERFTMDEGIVKAVVEVFVSLYEDGLIYRGERIINWCPRCQTALSDLEVIPTDRKGNLWHIRYPLEDGSEGLVVATTRPETLLGDTAVAIHPEDDRYRRFRGKKLKLPLMNRPIPVIEDDSVDREFGSGAVKITPAHDFNDNEMGLRHQLPLVSVIGKDGKITSAGGPYQGLALKEARQRVVSDLTDQGFVVETEDHAHKVGLCQRCDTVAEPIVSKQWFVKIAPLAEPAIKAVETGKIKFVPKNWDKTYYEWMRNIRDWCISRQLWWGHRIPAWYCEKCQHVMVVREAPSKCSECGAASLRQDEDVLDTWFSSQLWPFATLGWPEKTPALKTFYPNSIMETGFDIIFFWVARMIMAGMHFMKAIPFSTVFLHAMVRDEKGDKMSKSRGNVIDPLEVTQKHGTDPLRITFCVMAGQGRDIKLSLDRVEGYRAFCNKLWNAVKFLQFHWEKGAVSEPKGGTAAFLKSPKKLLGVNRWILARLNQVTHEVNQALENYEINVAAQTLYDFAWHELCDWYIELSKLELNEGSQTREETLTVLHAVLEQTLRLLHPFAPFFTEELWQSLPWIHPAQTSAREKEKKAPVLTISLQEYPQRQKSWDATDAVREVEVLQKVIDSLRTFRGENKIAPKKDFQVFYRIDDPKVKKVVLVNADRIQALCRVTGLVSLADSKPEGKEAVIPLTTLKMEMRVSLEGLVDFGEETRRLKKEIDRVNHDIAHVGKKLSNPKFVQKAPKDLVEKEKSRQKELQGKLQELEAALTRMSE